MPGYCSEALQQFRHDCRKPQDQPHQHTVPTYGATIQYVKQPDKSPTLKNDNKTFIQQVTGTFLYYARAVDSTMLVALSAIASQHTQNQQKK